jgi:hypothetical protein
MGLNYIEEFQNEFCEFRATLMDEDFEKEDI